MQLHRFNTKESATFAAIKLIDEYMTNTIDGNNFPLEQDFERDIRNQLQDAGYDVPPKKNIKNISNYLKEQMSFSQVNQEIPDIVINCKDGSVFLEVKFCDTPKEYELDIIKIKNYVRKHKCNAAYVLFLDKVTREGWTLCKKNPEYNFLFNEARASFPQI